MSWGRRGRTRATDSKSDSSGRFQIKMHPTTEQCSGREFAGRLAGEGELDGAGQGRKWNPNTNVHP